MLQKLRSLNDYSSFLPEKIKNNVKKEKYELLNEIRKKSILKSNSASNIAVVIKLLNSFEAINTTKYKSFHLYIFIIKYLWNSISNESLSPNLKSYVCQTISNVLTNIKKYILNDYFFEYDKTLLNKDDELDSSYFKEIGSDYSDNSYVDISDHYSEYKEHGEENEEVETSIDENKIQMLNDYYVTSNGIYEKHEDIIYSPNEKILINQKDESFRLYVQNAILKIIDYEYLFHLVTNYMQHDISNIDKKNINASARDTARLEEYCSHNAYKNFISSVVQLLVNLKNFCVYNIHVHNILVDYSFNNYLAIKYESYIGELQTEKEKDTGNEQNNDETNKNLNVSIEDKCLLPLNDIELCTRYNSIFLNFFLLNKFSSNDLCYKLIVSGKLLFLYKKIKRCKWNCINYAFVKMVYKGLKYAYIHNLDIKKEMEEIISILFFLFLLYMKLPNSVHLSQSKYYIPEEYTLLVNENDSVIKIISKICVYMLNRNFKKEPKVENVEKEKKTRLEHFLSHLEMKSFNINDFDENKDLFIIFEDVDIYAFLNIITSLFLPHIHPSNVGGHIGNINTFINSFLYCFIRKMKREHFILCKYADEEKESKAGERIEREFKKRKSEEGNASANNYFFGEEERKIVVNNFCKLIVQGMFPKISKGISLFENILKHICIIDLDCLDVFVKKIIDCLTNVNTTTQTCNSLLSVCLLLPIMIKYKPMYLKDLLYIMNIGIDICDVYKCFIIFSFLTIFFSNICILKTEDLDFQAAVEEYKKIAVYEDLCKQLTEEEIQKMINERKELSEYLIYWVYEFFDNILYFIKFSKNGKSKNKKKQNKDSESYKMENDLYSALKSTMISLFMHLDHGIVYELAEKFINSIELENPKYLAAIPHAIGMINNKKAFDLLFNFFYKKLVIKKKKKKRTNDIEGEKNGATTKEGAGLDSIENEEEFEYTKNTYVDEESAKCYLLCLSNLIRRADGNFININDIYRLLEIYIVEESNCIFKYICKIIYRFLEYHFSTNIKDHFCFEITEKISPKKKAFYLANWGNPWHSMKKNGSDEKTENVIDITEMITWKTPTKDDVRKGKNFIFLLVDYLLDILNQCNISICTPNLKKYVDQRKKKIPPKEWKFNMNYSNVISRLYRIIKSIVKPLSTLYPDERYNYKNLVTRCHIVNTKLAFYLYIYIAEFLVIISLQVLKLPKEIMDLSMYIDLPKSEKKIDNSITASNDMNVGNEKKESEEPIDLTKVEKKNTMEDIAKEKRKKLKEEFFTNIINTMTNEDVTTDAKIQRKLIKNIQLLLLKINERSNTRAYNDYINSVLSYTYNIYPDSFNFDIIKSQYINSIFYLFNERLKQRKKNYSYVGYRKQLCNVLFFINLSIYSQVRGYAQTAIKLIVPSIKSFKVSFLEICIFYLKNYTRLYTLRKDKKSKEKKKELDKNTSISIEEEKIGELKQNDSTQEKESKGMLTRENTLQSIIENHEKDYFENKCLSCFNGIIMIISNSMGIIKKITSDMHILKKYIKIMIEILKLEIQKEEITSKCMKLIYTLINNRFFKDAKSNEQKKKKKILEIISMLVEESKKKNNVYVHIVILSFFICFNNYMLENDEEFYFMYLIENLSVKKNVHVYNLAFVGFVRLLNYYYRYRLEIPSFVIKEFQKETVYKNFVDICIYKNLKSKKKSNSINAIISNLSKPKKFFKGHGQMGDVTVRDFFSCYMFFKFLLKLQKNRVPSEQEHKEKNIQSTQQEHVDTEDTNNFDGIKYLLNILNQLQKDEHSENELKSALITVLSALIASLKKLSNQKEVNDYLEDSINILEKEIAVVNGDVFNVWLYCFHLLFMELKKKHISVYKKLIDFCCLCNLQDVSNLIVKKKMHLLNIIVFYSMHKNSHLLDQPINTYLRLINDGNITIRQRIGDLIATILYVTSDHKFYSHLRYMHYHLLLYLYNIANEVIMYLKDTEELSKQTNQIYALETLAYITLTLQTERRIYVLNNVSILFLKMFILSLRLIDNYINDLAERAMKCLTCPTLYLFEFQEIHWQKETNESVTEIELFKQMDSSAFDDFMKKKIEHMMIQTLACLLNDMNWKIRNSALKFCHLYHSYYCLFFYNKKEHSFILNAFISLLMDKYVEIQNSARVILSSVFCYYDSNILQHMGSYFLTLLNVKNPKGLTKSEMEKTEDKELKIIERKRQLSIYILISLINSFPNFVPTWLPKILINVAKKTNTSTHVIKKEIEKCIQNFLRSHKDEWEYKYRSIFTEDQLNLLDMYKGGLNYFT